MKKKAPTKDQIRKYTKEFTRLAINYVNKEFDLNLEKYGKFKTIISFDKRRVASVGVFYRKNGKRIPSINLDLSELLKKRKNTFREYEHFDKIDKKRIGTLCSITWKKYVRVLVSHEISHIIEPIILGVAYNIYNVHKPYHPKVYDSKITKKMRKELKEGIKKFKLNEEAIYNHGAAFIAVYMHIRDKFVNGKSK